MTEQDEIAMLKSADSRCSYVGRRRMYVASAIIAGKRRRATGSTFDGAFTVLAALSITLTGCPPTSSPTDAAEAPDAREDDATDIDATYGEDAFSDDADELAADAPADDAASSCEAPDVCPPGYSWTPCACATDCVPPACGADQ